MQQVLAPIISTRRAGPGATLLTARAQEIAVRARPGQFVMVRCSEGSDPLLRRPFPLFTITPPDIALLVRADEPGRRWLAHQSPGQTLDILGPFGQGFIVDPLSRHLLLVAEGLGLAALAALAAQANSAGMPVTVLAGAPSTTTLLPADLLPPEIEYRVATADGSRGQRGNVAALLPEIIQWADQVFAAGSPALYHALADAIARYRLRVDDDFAQVWQLGTVACGAGACQCCAIDTRRGLVLSCREGPVLKLRQVETW